MMIWLVAGLLLCALVPLAVRELRWYRFQIPEACRDLVPSDPARTLAGQPIKIEDKLSIVLPIKIRVHHEHSELERIQQLLLPSIQKFMELDELHEFLIVTPPADVEEVRKGVEAFALPLRD